MNIKILNNAKDATGLAIIIDVFRAFTVESYIMNNGALKIIPVGDKEIAYKYKEQYPEYILVGERDGVKLEGFDYGNSPSQVENIDFTNKIIVHTTSCGTQGIVNAINAKEIITGSLVNASAICKYIIQNNIQEVSIVAMARPGEKPFDEDLLCAKYLKCLLENKNYDNLDLEIENLKQTTGAKFFDKLLQKDFPEKDYYLCTEKNKFNFVIKINKDSNGKLYTEKIEI